MTEWYVPEVLNQFDGSKCQGNACWAAVGAMMADAATTGAVNLTPMQFRASAGGGSGAPEANGCRSGFESDIVDGLNTVGIRSWTVRCSVGAARRILSPDKAAIFALATDYELWPVEQDCVRVPFEGNHMVLLVPGVKAGRIGVLNPLCHRQQRVELEAVLDAGLKFAKEHGRGRTLHMVRVQRQVPLGLTEMEALIAEWRIKAERNEAALYDALESLAEAQRIVTAALEG